MFHVVIPARHASKRLPGKPLRAIGGKTMIEHVHARAGQSGAREVVIATDDERVRRVAEAFGARVCMTSPDHATGTDRIAQAARSLGWPDETIVVNVQGDEPLINPALIRLAAEDLAAHPAAGISTLCTPFADAALLFDPNSVKVVVDAQGYALYFSRAPIPWHRDAFARSKDRIPDGAGHLRHIGLYAYRAGLLKRYADLPPSAAEKAESLEQLRALTNGVRIHVAVTTEPTGPCVDTEEDLARVEALLRDAPPP